MGVSAEVDVYFLNDIENIECLMIKVFSVFGEECARVTSRQKACAKFNFELFDLLTDVLRRGTQSIGGFVHRGVVCHFDKSF